MAYMKKMTKPSVEVEANDVEKIELPAMEVIRTSDDYCEKECYTIWFKD